MFEERYGRKTRLVVASSTSFVLPLGAKAQSFHCSSSPHQTHFVGLWRGPCPKAALWNLAFIRGLGGETCGRPTNFPQGDFLRARRVQLTRFRPVRRRAGGVRFARLRRKAKHHLFSAISLPKALLPPDSCVLHRVQRFRNIYRISNLICSRKAGGCAELDSSPSLRASDRRHLAWQSVLLW